MTVPKVSCNHHHLRASKDGGEPIQQLLADAFADSTNLAQKEFALFKAEMGANMRTLAMAIGMFVGAAVFAVISLSLLIQSLVEWLATKLESETLASLIVAVLMGAVAGLVLYGRSKLSATTLTPERTLRNVQRDARVVTEATND